MRLSASTLRAAAISLDETRAEMARQLLRRRERQRVNDRRYRERHLERLRTRERERAHREKEKRRAYQRALEAKPEYVTHRKLMKLARQIHRDTGRPLRRVHAELGVVAKRFVGCGCRACGEEE